ncbi:MAG: zinc ribbon domain-containing protein [Myxococcales bacterium]|nr:zinc ribbon domain-containing protein [Myxococcales bacterium]
MSQTTRCVCVKCGADRQEVAQICPSCGHRPEGEGLLVAWLLSDANLPAMELDQVQKRIRDGEVIRPSGRMLDRARRAMGATFATDEGMTSLQRLGLLATNLLATPLVGWVLVVWWRTSRPRASLQALALTLPASVLFTALVVYLAS